MSVAIPKLMDDLHIDALAAQWLSTAFMLTMAVVIPITGFLLQRFTTRAGLHRRHVAVLLRNAAGRPGSRLRRPRGGPRRPGVRHGHHASAPHDDADDAGPAGQPRPHDGQRLHRHLGRAGHRADHLRRHPQLPVLALDVPHRPSDRPRDAADRNPLRRERDRDPQGQDRRGLRHPVRPRLRRPALRSQPGGRGRLGRRIHRALGRGRCRRPSRSRRSSSGSCCCSAGTGPCSTCAPSARRSSRWRSCSWPSPPPRCSA